MKAVVLAGGGGKRLWPLSSDHFPKQFLSFGPGGSLLQKSVLRLIRSSFIDQVIVATNEIHRPLVEKQLQEIGVNCPVLVEPLRRNTAPAIALAMKYLETEFGVKRRESVLIVPSDHLIEPEVVFLHALEQLKPESKLITFGIRPTKPETGYGYIEIGGNHNPLTFEVKRFIEKPNRKTAESYVSNPHFFWNSGMFLFTIETFWRELKTHAEEVALLFEESWGQVVERFGDLPDISIDYALMEKSKNVLVCPLAISWSDVGCWDSVYEMMEKDHDQNVKIGRVLTIDTTNSLIIGEKRVISTIGLDDLLIVETEEAVLISKRGESQQVKALLQELQKKGASLEEQAKGSKQTT